MCMPPLQEQPQKISRIPTFLIYKPATQQLYQLINSTKSKLSKGQLRNLTRISNSNNNRRTAVPNITGLPVILTDLNL